VRRDRRSPPRAWLALLLALPALAADLEVAVRPGSPLDWGRAFPALSPGSGELFADTPAAPKPAERRTTTRHARPRPDVQLTSSLGLLRILTWDLTAHLDWLRRDLERVPPPRTGGDEPPLPAPAESLYWASLAPFLRLYLHPAVLARHEVLAHLVEIGDPVLAVLEGVRSEASLREAANSVEKLVTAARVAPSPRPGRTPRETMLARFVHDELLACHPYDPDGAFGQRLFLLGREAWPILLGYTASSNASLRRNAVTAVGRYRDLDTADALLRLATETTDPVALVRALAALGQGSLARSPVPLLERMKGCDDKVLLAALAGALGRLGAEEAVPALLSLGRRGLETDSDLLITALDALARIVPAVEREEAVEFADEVLRDVRKAPRGFQPAGPLANTKPDIPDAPEARGEVLLQLALILRVRLEPTNEDLRRRLLALVQVLELGPKPGGLPEGSYSDASLRGVHPPARLLLLETLADLGGDGHAVLATLAGDRTLDPELRGVALAQLPHALRAELLREALGGAESAEMRAQAFGVLALEGGAPAEEAARNLLKDCARAEPGAGLPAQRYLYLLALRTLSQRGALAAPELLPLMIHPRRVEAAFGDLPSRVRARCGELVERVAGGIGRQERDAAIEELVDLVVAAALNPELGPDQRGAARAHVDGQLGSVRAHKSDVAYQHALADAIATYLLGFTPIVVQAPSVFGAAPLFRPHVPLEEEILLALGRTRSEEGAAELASFLGNTKNVHRATAALALGMTGRTEAAGVLPPLLLDGDPFVRFCAAESLRHLAGEAADGEVFVDWMYGSSAERVKAAERWFVRVAGGR
jgi:HEAT repeat protein